MKNKIIDCFTFFNELEMLEFRLTELDPYVDKFVIIESTKTFTGKPKPLYYNLNKSKFKDWHHKIIHKIVYDMPISLNQDEIDKLVSLPEIRDINWVREHHQRRQIGDVLEKLDLDHQDIILVSDLDEIPDLRNSNEFINLLKFGPVVFEQDWYIWNLNNFKNSNWRGTSAFYYSHYINNKDIFQHIRNVRWDRFLSEFLMVRNGWHFSWFGNQEFIKQKMFSFAHTETANEFFKNKDNITYLVENSLPPQVPSESTVKLNYVSIIPENLPTNYEIIPHYFAHKTKVFDCFMIHNELDMLELRLNELNDYVDYFIIIESQNTHSGKIKELSYQKEMERFKKFEDKIIYVIIEELPTKLPNYIENIDINWFRENFQRNQIKNALMQLDVKDKDIIMISDIDEIPDLSNVNIFEITPENDFITCSHLWFNWNYEWIFEDVIWPGTQIMLWKYLKNTTPQKVRDDRYNEDKLHKKSVWGWHLSWFGTNKEIFSKLDSFAHQEIEYVSEEVLNHKRNIGDAIVSTNLSRYTGNYLPKYKNIPYKKQNLTYKVDFE
jgi:beta-1,4-mannosyl-glycoprotein beta-1,4-N-acetylglucosaminyltransferase